MGLASQTKDTQGTQNQQSQTNPWGPQSGYLTQGFQDAQNALNQANGAKGPDGFTAQYTPDQLAAFQQQLGYGTGNSNIPGSSGAAGGALTGAGATATGQGLYGLQNFNPTNTTGNVMSGASAYSNNPDTQGMIDAATLDARRAVNEGAMPQISRDANMSGNVNSNRTGIAQGITERGLADTVANTSANIRGGLYNSGLNLASNQLAGNDTNRLNALNSLTSGGTNAVGTGVGANSGAVGQQAGLFGIANQGIGGQQAGQQANLTNQLQQWGFDTNSPFAGLNNYWNIVGGQNYGSQGSSSGNYTQNQQSTPSPLSQIGQGMGFLSQFFPNMFKGS